MDDNTYAEDDDFFLQIRSHGVDDVVVECAMMTIVPHDGLMWCGSIVVVFVNT